MKTFQKAALLTVTVSCCAMFGKGMDSAKRLDASTAVLKEMMGADDKGVPKDLVEQAECVVVVPGLKKAGFIFGGKYGKGFASCRSESGWTAPAAVRIEGGSFGLQAGASETDVIMIVRNADGKTKLLQDKFTIGAGAEATAGPIGRDLSAQTDAQLHAQILSYSRSKGLFGGLTLNGATLRPDNDDNKELYGAGAMSNKEILSGSVPAPASAAGFEAELKRYSRHKM